MARNRKNQTSAIRFAPAIWALLLCLVVIGAGVGYVWLKTQIYQLGQQQWKLERRLADLRAQNKKLDDCLQGLRSMPRLEARVRELRLGLGPPQPSKIWWLVEPGTDAPLPAPPPRSQFAAQQAPPGRAPGAP